MANLAVGHRQRIRDLSLGPVPWGAWSWTFQDGSCWAALGFEGGEMVGWAALTMEVDTLPVIGAFVAEPARGRGIGTTLVTTLLSRLVGLRVLERGAQVFNSTWRFPAYDAIIAGCGLHSVPWQ